MTLNEWAKEIHDNAVEHGFYEKEARPFPEVLALCHSELSEALEEDRAGRPMLWYGEHDKPEGIAIEMVDCLIRILDWFGYRGINVEKMVEIKHNYNKKRPYKHGKEY